MKAFRSATRQFFRQIAEDAMLAVLPFVPILMGVAFRFGVPALEQFLCARTGQAAILAPYYPLFDLLLSAMTPIMFTAAGALAILDEADSGMSRALVASPLGRNGYLASRVGVPALIATLYCVVITAVFSLSRPNAMLTVLLSLCSGALGVAVALMLPALARNRVEGMAISKLSGLVMLGLPAALLLPSPYQYAAGVLPTFWMTKLMMGGSSWNVLPALVTSILLAALFVRRFGRRVL